MLTPTWTVCSDLLQMNAVYADKIQLTFKTMNHGKITNLYKFYKLVFKIRKIRILGLWFDARSNS